MTNVQLPPARNPAPAPDWNRSFLDDQAHQYLRQDMQVNQGKFDRDQRLERCVLHLMALANCSKRTAATCAARAIAEIESINCPLYIDIDRSTSTALFVVDRATNSTRIITAAELLQYLRQSEPSATRLDAQH